MAEQTTTKSDGTIVTDRVPDVVPDLKNNCQAVVTTQIAVCEPMSDGSWRLVSAFTDNYNIVLDTRQPDDAKSEVIDRLREIKEKWTGEEKLVSLENLMNLNRPSQNTEHSSS